MKKLITLIALASTINVNAQYARPKGTAIKDLAIKTWTKQTMPKNLISKGLFFVAGASDGLAESLKFHYSSFKKRFPNANNQYWNPAISWTNKYKNHDVKQGENFPLSTTALVGVTDGYHLSRSIRNISLMTGVTFTIGDNKKWSDYLTDFIINSCAYSAGFNLTYEFLKH